MRSSLTGQTCLIGASTYPGKSGSMIEGGFAESRTTKGSNPRTVRRPRSTSQVTAVSLTFFAFSAAR